MQHIPEKQPWDLLCLRGARWAFLEDAALFMRLFPTVFKGFFCRSPLQDQNQAEEHKIQRYKGGFLARPVPEMSCPRCGTDTLLCESCVWSHLQIPTPHAMANQQSCTTGANPRVLLLSCQ